MSISTMTFLVSRRTAGRWSWKTTVLGNTDYMGIIGRRRDSSFA